MKQLLLFSAMCFFSIISFGQTNVEVQKRAVPTNNPKFIEFKNNHDAILTKQGGPGFVSSYFGYEETLKSFFIGNTIPTETPKSETFIYKTPYIKALNEWIEKHKDLLKPEHKNSLITE